MKRRMCWVSAVLTAALLVGTLAACGSGQSGGEETSAADAASGKSTEAADGTIELTAFAMEGPYTKGNFNDLRIWDVTEKNTGIKVDFEAVPFESIAEQLGLKMASNQLPDMLFKCPLNVAEVTKYAADGQLVPIEEYLEEYAPNFSALMKADPSIEKAITMADGHIYGFPYLVTAAPSRITPKMFYNKTWLDAQGLAVPTTTEELYTTLKAMKDYDYNENGKADEVPLVFDNLDAMFKSLGGSFGLYNKGAEQMIWDLDPETEQLRYIPTSEAYKELLQYLNRLYTEGLVDQEVFSLGNDAIAKVTAKATQNLIGMAFVHNSNFLGERENDYSYFEAPLVGPEGDQIYVGRTIPVAGMNTFITNVDENIPETIRWIDQFYSDEGVCLYFMGIEGETYEMVDGKAAFTDYVLNNPDGLNMEEALGTYVCWSGGGNPSIADDDHFGNWMIGETTVEGAAALAEYTPTEIWGPFPYSTEDSEELSVLRTDIDTYVNDMRAKFVTGQVSFDEWDDYVASIEKMGLENYREITQRALDTYNSR